MASSTEFREFLASRRARVAPAQVGIRDDGRRRVQGLRRQEVAVLAGVSEHYYLQIERGKARGVSADVLSAIARALQLDSTETAYMFDLAGLHGQATEPADEGTTVPETVLSMINAMTDVPAVVLDGCLDIVATNSLGRQLYARVYDFDGGAPNLARFVFGGPLARDFYPDWATMADYVVSLVRAESARSPGNEVLSRLIADLGQRSAEFLARWMTHDVAVHDSGVKDINHPVVGLLHLSYQGLDIPGAAGLRVFGYTPVAGDTLTASRMLELHRGVTAT